MKDFRKLNVWEKAHHFVLEVYKITKAFPNEELFGLTSQFKRASVSIPTNIVEGNSRRSDKDFARFLQISIGSASETEYLLFLCYDLNFLQKTEFEKLLEEVISVRKMLINLIKKLK